jgi:hypothetical protein
MIFAEVFPLQETYAVRKTGVEVITFTVTIFSGNKIIVEEKSHSFSTTTKILPT